MLVCKVNELQMKGKHESIITNFFKEIGDEYASFSDCVTGYACIYAPYYVIFLESENNEFLDRVL